MNYKLSILCILFFATLLNENGQKINYLELKDGGFIKPKVPEDKSVLIFESSLDLEFSSSMERLTFPTQKGDYYYLEIIERTCIIKIINKQTKSEVEIPFGQLSEKTLPVINKGTYKIFRITENDQELVVYNQTEVKKREGSNDKQMLYEKEALLILNVDPADLEFEIESSSSITAIKHY